MSTSALPIFLGAGILLVDIIAAGIIFFALQRREHALTYVIPPIILFTGIVSAGLVNFFLSQSAN